MSLEPLLDSRRVVNVRWNQQEQQLPLYRSEGTWCPEWHSWKGWQAFLRVCLSLFLSISFLLFRRSTFSALFPSNTCGRVLNYPGRTSSDCPTVIACQLSAFDVIKLILGLNFGPCQRAKGQLLSGFPLFTKNFPWGSIHRKNPSVPPATSVNNKLSYEIYHN